MNDGQHCAVGPGLQSPQRWSFPPASISLRRLPPLVAQQQQQQPQLFSLHPSVSPGCRETSIFLPRCRCSPPLSTTGRSLWKVPLAGAVRPPGPSFVQFGQIAQSYERTTEWRQLHSRKNCFDMRTTITKYAHTMSDFYFFLNLLIKYVQTKCI